MNDAREALRAIARDARVILERERARGRAAITGLRVAPPPGGDAVSLPGASRDAFEPGAPGSPARPQASVGGAELLALPGFEDLAVGPNRAARARTLSLRPDLAQDLETLARDVAECRRCALCATRTQTVFADGSATARLAFVGEAPGRDEDAQGLPFVGRAGQLLNKMIAAIGMKREEVYICNVLKCRPPDNRVPQPGEVEQCRPYLEQQLALIRPALICALGLSAAQALLGTKASMASIRGKRFVYRGIPLIPTYHPAALLRTPSLKRQAWEDLKRVREFLASAPGA